MYSVILALLFTNKICSDSVNRSTKASHQVPEKLNFFWAALS